MNDELKETPICTCKCHTAGVDIMHFMECCELIYQEYLNDDGTINIELWSVAFENTFSKAKPTFTLIDGKYYWVHK